MFSKRISQGDNKYLQVEICYDNGGYSTKRGYYIYIYPLEIEKIGGFDFIARNILAGKYRLLKEVTRKSKKAEQEAEAIARESYPQYFVS
jgi:hypothetical protein